MVQPIDQGSILRSGAALIPDYASQMLQRQQMQMAQNEQNMQRQMFQAKQSAEAEKMQRQNDYGAAIQEYLADPKTEKLLNIMARFPEHQEGLKAAYTGMDKRQRESDLQQQAEIYGFARNGRLDLAAKKLRERIAADEAAGVADDGDREILAGLESTDPAVQKQALGMIEMAVAAANPDKFNETFKTLNPVEAKSPFEREYEYRVERFGQESADSWRAVNDAKLIPVQEGGQVFNAADILTGKTTGQVQSTEGGGQASSGGGVSSGGKGSRGERNNNPGNLEASAWTKKQPGYKGTDGRFAIFDTPENGRKAQERLLINNYLSKGHDTPSKVINRYGNDPGPEDDKSVQNYIAYVSRRLGINPNDKIPAGKAALLAQAMREFETGKTKQTGPKKITSKSQYDQLASGTEYIAPDGSRRRKP